ncbi:MAG: putative signal transducing protein [Gemmataceae bacterium]
MDLVTVSTYSTSAAAEMAKNFLVNEGIEAFIEAATTGDMLHLGGEVKLQVAQENAEQAARLLKDAEFHSEEADETDEGDEE